jgi:hypothetical protein
LTRLLTPWVYSRNTVDLCTVGFERRLWDARIDATRTLQRGRLRAVGGGIVDRFAVIVNLSSRSRGDVEVHCIGIDTGTCRSEHVGLPWLSIRPRWILALSVESRGGIVGSRLSKRQTRGMGTNS